MVTKSEQTKSDLLFQARKLYWSRGFSNVSLREISRAAGVDVALVSRYFGSKRGLFEATLCALPPLDAAQAPDAEALIALIVDLFATTARDPDVPSPTALILMNASDPEVGALVRQTFTENLHAPFTLILGDPARAALFSAAILGMSVVEKVLFLDGIEDHTSAAYRTQLETFLRRTLDLPT